MVTVDKKTRYKVPYQRRKGNVAENKVVSVENQVLFYKNFRNSSQYFVYYQLLLWPCLNCIQTIHHLIYFKFWSSKPWTRNWIRIRIKSMRIHNPLQKRRIRQFQWKAQFHIMIISKFASKFSCVTVLCGLAFLKTVSNYFIS